MHPTIQARSAFIHAILDGFEKQRSDRGRLWVIREGAMEEACRDLVQYVHDTVMDGALPCDPVYDAIVEILGMLDDIETDAIDDDTSIIEMDMEVEPETYLQSLYAWVTSHACMTYWVDQALVDLRLDSLFDLLQSGQRAWKQEIAETVWEFVCARWKQYTTSEENPDDSH